MTMTQPVRTTRSSKGAGVQLSKLFRIRGAWSAFVVDGAGAARGYATVADVARAMSIIAST